MAAKRRDTSQAAGGGQLGPGGQALRAGCAHTHTHTGAHTRGNAQQHPHAQPRVGLPRPRESRKAGDAKRGRSYKDAEDQGTDHSSLVIGLLLAGSCSRQALQPVRPPPGSLPSQASRLSGPFLEASYLDLGRQTGGEPGPQIHPPEPLPPPSRQL